MDEVGSDVSVVIPCFRSGATIERALRSVVGQTRRPAEVLLVDDASGDGSVERLHDLARGHPGLVTVLELRRNGGAGAARNAGWERATGQLVAFLDADDSWHPRKVELQASYMERRPEMVLTGTGSRVVPVEAVLGGVASGPTPEDVTPSPVEATPVTVAGLLRANAFLTSSTMVRRTLPARFPDRRTSEDYELWLRVVLGGLGAAVLPPVLAYRHRRPFGDGGLSGRLWQMERGELAALRRVHRDGLLPTAAYARAVGWSVGKFGRRLAVAGTRRLRSPD